jgi:hypothetical protein
MIVQPIQVIQNDYGYQLGPFNLQDANGDAQDLTAAILKIRVQDAQDPTNALLFEGTMVVDSAAHGICHYNVVTGNFPVPGTFNFSIQVTYSGAPITWGTYQIIVKPSLPQANN